MEITHNDKVLDLKFTFNSFKYMEELDLGELSSLDTKPFKMIGICEILLHGALNYDSKNKYDEELVEDILEKTMEEGKLFELLEHLIVLLEESSFFKNLQGEKVTKKKSK